MKKIAIGLTRALLVVFAILIIINACNNAGGSGATDLEEKEMEICLKTEEIFCEKAFECKPSIAPSHTGVSDSSECDTAARNACEAEDDTELEDGELDPGGEQHECENQQMPTEKQIQDCLDAIETAECDELMTLEETGPCAVVGDMMDCDVDHEETDSNDSEGKEDSTDTNDTGEKDTEDSEDTQKSTDTDEIVTTDSHAEKPTDTQPQDTTGCEAAVTALCDLSKNCPAGVQNAFKNCSKTISSKESEIETACQTYLDEAVPSEVPLAIYLTTTDPSTISTCVSSQSCNLKLANDLIQGLADFAQSGSSDDLNALLEDLLATCSN